MNTNIRNTRTQTTRQSPQKQSIRMPGTTIPVIIWPRHSRLLPNPNQKNTQYLITTMHRNTNRNRPLPRVTSSTWTMVKLDMPQQDMPATTNRWWPITGNVFGSSCC